MRGIIAIPILLSFICCCGRITDTSDGAVVAFIVAVEEHNMNKAWNLLGSDAQVFYNNLGEKQRRSGKGALENEIKRIKRFRNVKKDYKIVKVQENPMLIKIQLLGGMEFFIQTVDEEGAYKLKDGNAVRNLLTAISAETEREGY